MFSLEELFCDIDDFCRQFEPRWHSQLLTQGLKTRKRAKSMSLSEIITVAVSEAAPSADASHGQALSP